MFEEPLFRDQKGLEGRALGGWEIAGIYTVNTGLPLTVYRRRLGLLGHYNLPTGITGVYNNRNEQRLRDRQLRPEHSRKHVRRHAAKSDWGPEPGRKA